MISFLARRLLNYLVLLVLASFLAFSLASVTFHPLDSFIERHPQPPAEAIHAKAVELGLDKPVPIRYAEWATRAPSLEADIAAKVRALLALHRSP